MIKKTISRYCPFKGTGIFKEKGLFGNAAQETENNIGA